MTTHVIEDVRFHGYVSDEVPLTAIPKALDELLSQPQFNNLKAINIQVVCPPKFDAPVKKAIIEGMPRVAKRDIFYIWFYDPVDPVDPAE